MEIKAQLMKPYTEEARISFIVEQNHTNCYEIRETETALEAWGYTEQEKQQQERERLDKLSMTRSDFFDGMILAFGLDSKELRAVIENILNSLNITDIEVKVALNNYDNALNFYRKHTLFTLLSGIEIPISEEVKIVITSEQWDKFFETKDYHYLTTCKLTINPTPAEATVVIDSEVVNEVTVPYGSVVDYVVSCDGYESKADVFEITKDEFLEVVLDEDTTDTTESDISI